MLGIASILKNIFSVAITSPQYAIQILDDLTNGDAIISTGVGQLPSETPVVDAYPHFDLEDKINLKGSVMIPYCSTKKIDPKEKYKCQPKEQRIF